jgi:hypothetical protein
MKINPLFLSTPENPSHSIPLIVANSVTIVNYFPPFVNISLLETGSQHRIKYCSGWNYIAVFFPFPVEGRVRKRCEIIARTIREL